MLKELTHPIFGSQEILNEFLNIYNTYKSNSCLESKALFHLLVNFTEKNMYIVNKVILT